MRKNLVVLLIPLLLGTVFATCSMSDDAYKYPEYAGSEHGQWISEWWYFTIDAENVGVDLYFIYDIDNPDNMAGGFDKQSSISYGVMASGIEARNVIDAEVFTEDYSASTTTLNVAIGDNSVYAVDEDTIRITGNLENEGLAWNLVIDRANVPCFPQKLVHTGIFAWENMGWQAFMASGIVNGWVIIDGTNYTISNAKSYHDHQWGPSIVFNWKPWYHVSVIEDNFALAGFNRELEPFNNFLIVYNDGEFIEFNGLEVNVGMRDYAWSPVLNDLYPTRYVVDATNCGYKLSAEISEDGETWFYNMDDMAPIYTSLVKSSNYNFVGTLYERYGLLNLKKRPVYSFDAHGDIEWIKPISFD